MSHTWMSHVTHANESCHTYAWVMAHMAPNLRRSSSCFASTAAVSPNDPAVCLCLFWAFWLAPFSSSKVATCVCMCVCVCVCVHGTESVCMHEKAYVYVWKKESMCMYGKESVRVYLGESVGMYEREFVYVWEVEWARECVLVVRCVLICV